MIDYTGYECPICGKTFRQDDDVVVCPECGAPHHRECYTAHGQCGCAENHGTDQAWDKKQESSENTMNCPYCGAQINDNAVICSHCGQSIGQNNTQQNPYQQQGYQTQQGRPVYGAPQRPYGAGGYNPYDPLAGHDADEDFGGATAQQLMKLTRTNTRKYFYIFTRIRDYNRGRFNFLALIFGAFYLLYRKQYKKGILWGCISAVLFIGQILCGAFFTTPTLNILQEQLGVAANTEMNAALLNQMGQELFKMGGGTVFLFILPVLCSAALLGVHIFIAIKSYRWYYQHCIETAKDIERTCATSEEKEENYRKRGGVQVVFIFAFLAAHMLSSYATVWLGNLF